MKTLIENLIKKTCHAESISASKPLPEFIKSLPTLTGRATCVKLKLLSFKSSPVPTGRATCVKLKPVSSKFSPMSTVRATCVAPLSRPSDTLSLGEGRKYAFTLAETLITLGIIGIVAVLILPGLIHKFQMKVLENQFKVADAIIQDLLLQVKEEYALTGFGQKDIYNFCGGRNCATNGLGAEVNTYWINLLQNKKKAVNPCIKNKSGIYFENSKRYKDYKGATGLTGTRDYCWEFPGMSSSGLAPSYKNIFLLPNGVLISPIGFQTHGLSDGIKIGFDVNGPFKGPNILGYDIFIYNTGYWFPYGIKDMCDYEHKTWNSAARYGCYNYAKKNESPTDSSKRYFENLK